MTITRIAFALAAAAAAYGQTAPVAGDWQAGLEVNATKLRLVLHIARTGAGLSASLDSLDQGAPGLAVDAIQHDGRHLHFEMANLGARYDGDWNPATRQIEGRWLQGPADLPLNWSFAAPSAAAKEQPLSDADRAFLLEYLNRTRDGVLAAIAQLTPAQWNYKPGAGRWSIAECVEHLILEEQMIYRAVNQQVIRLPLPDGQPRAGREHDQQIIQYLTDRSQKTSAAESIEPHGTLTTAKDGIARFSKVRADTIGWVQATGLDLRAHGTANPTFQFLDAYGYWILTAAHSARHTAQMEEVKAAPGYPK
jgi:hypothetical protein